MSSAQRPNPKWGSRAVLLAVGIAFLAVAGSGAANGQGFSVEIANRLKASGLSPSDFYTTNTPMFNLARARLISLREVALETLANNLNIDISRLNLGIASDQIKVNLGIYDPLLAIQAVRTRTDTRTSNLPVSEAGVPLPTDSNVNNDLFQSTLSELTPLGSVFTLGYSDSNTNVLDSRKRSLVNPFYEQVVSLSAVQPLLQNFGPTVTNAQIRISRHQEKISQYGILQQIDNQVTLAMRSYWNLVFTIENLSVQELLLKQAQELLRVNEIKYQTGVLAQTDVLQAKAQVALAISLVIQARSDIGTAEDILRRTMNPDRDPQEWDVPLIPEDMPQPMPVEIQEKQAIADALANRPELLQAREEILIAQIGRDVTSWQRLPQLNLIGSYAVSGGGDQNHRAWMDVEDNDFNSYQAGIQFLYPIGNRKARYQYRQSLKQLETSELQLQNTEANVILDVRNAVRQLLTGEQAITATKSSVESEQAKLDAEMKRFDVGMATSFEVLTFQKDLANARVSYLQALTSYSKALIDLDRARSSLRDKLLAMGIPVELLSDNAKGSPEAPVIFRPPAKPEDSQKQPPTGSN